MGIGICCKPPAPYDCRFAAILQEGISLKKCDSLFSSFFWRRYCNIFLAFSWCAGLLLGQLLLLKADDPVFALFRRASSEIAPFWGLLISAVFPLVLSAFILIAFRPQDLVLLCFFQAFLYSYILLGICLSMGFGGWLFRFSLLLYDLSITLEYWFWQHYLSGEHKFSFPVLFLLIALVILGICFQRSILFPLRECF